MQARLTTPSKLSDNIQMSATVLKLNVARLPSVNRAEEVARELRHQIRSGALSPQMRLPSEHMMAAQFGVSRAIIREAVARLRNEGLVKTRQGSGAYGNAATRVEAFMTSKGTLSFLKDPQVDEWYTQQAVELDRKKREAILHKIQQKVYDEANFIPMWELGFLCASGPRVAVSGLGLISVFIYSAPYEEVRLKG